jgi:hypothetical protein
MHDDVVIVDGHSDGLDTAEQLPSLEQPASHRLASVAGELFAEALPYDVPVEPSAQ